MSLFKLGGRVRTVVFLLLLATGVSFAPVLGAQEVYTVLPGDTFSRIARGQGVSLTALREANPNQSESLQPGDHLQVPQAIQFPDLSNSTSWAPIDSLLNYEVQAADTWYGIAKRYEVSIDSLRHANPSSDESLQQGTFIRIPGKLASTSNGTWEERRSELLKKASDTRSAQNIPSRHQAKDLEGALQMGSIPYQVNRLERFQWVSPKKKRPAVITSDTLHILAMLPYLLPVDTIIGGDYDAKTKRLREIALEFTHGIQWGAQLLKEAGFHVSLRLVDTESDSLGAAGWEQADLEWADVVLGPLRRSVLDSVATLLLPLETPQWILTESPHHWREYPHMLLIDSHREAGMKKLGKYAAQNHANDTIIVLKTDGKDAGLEQAFIEGFRMERGSEEGLVVWPATSHFAEGLTSLMDTSKLNVVAIPAGASARSMMAHVQTELQLADSFPVKLYANPQSLSYEFMEWDFVDRVLWTLPSDNWMQRTDSVFKVKNGWFLDEFATEPSDYALRGCDAVIESSNWMKPRRAPVPSAIRTRFFWEQDPLSGKLRNEAWKIIEFSGGDWKEVSVQNSNWTLD